VVILMSALSEPRDFQHVHSSIAKFFESAKRCNCLKWGPTASLCQYNQ